MNTAKHFTIFCCFCHFVVQEIRNNLRTVEKQNDIILGITEQCILRRSTPGKELFIDVIKSRGSSTQGHQGILPVVFRIYIVMLLRPKLNFESSQSFYKCKFMES